MNIKIIGVRNPGELDSERLVLRVTLAPTDVGEFAIFRAAIEDESVTTGISDVFWFPDKAVKAGDLIVLYTKTGTATDHVNKNGSTSHFFYWGVEKPIWQTDNFGAVLTHIDQWTSVLDLEKKVRKQA